MTSPTFAARHFAAGVTAQALAHAPMLEFDRHDAFQRRFLKQVTRAHIDPPRHFIPSSTEFATAIEYGMGWGMLPEAQCRAQLGDGRLVELGANPAIELPLYWQRWNLDSPILDALTRIVCETAQEALRC